MQTGLLAISSFGLFLIGCTTAGAPAPGELTRPVKCEVGESWVCTGGTSSRIKRENGTCSCQVTDTIPQF